MEISSSGTSVLLSIGTSEEDWEAVVVEESAALTGTKLNLLLLKKSLAWKHEMDWGWTETSGDFVSWRGGRQWNRWPEEEDTVAPPGMVLHSNNIILVCFFQTQQKESQRNIQFWSLLLNRQIWDYVASLFIFHIILFIYLFNENNIF